MLARATPAVYLLALICFLLPFIEVSCNGQKVVSLTGVQLVVGTTVGGGSGTRAEHIQPSTPAVLAFVLGLFGLIFAMIGKWRRLVVSGAAGLLAGICLLFLQNEVPSGAPPEALGLLKLSYDPAYYVSVLLFFAGAGLCAFMEYSGGAKQTTGPPVPMPLPQAAPLQAAKAAAASAPGSWQPANPSLPAGAARICASCGSDVDWDARFCSTCGAVQS